MNIIKCKWNLCIELLDRIVIIFAIKKRADNINKTNKEDKLSKH